MNYRLFTLLVLPVLIYGQKLNPKFQLLPLPQSIQIIDEKGIDADQINYISIADNVSIPVLKEPLANLPQYKKSGFGIELILTSTATPLSDEGYLLEINKKGITIASRNKKGLFYGCQTLNQLLQDSRDFNIKIPFLKIIDSPAISYRAIHFDNKHHLSNTNYYYQVIDKLAQYKINAIIWEIDDKLKYVRRPEVAAPNALSKQEVQAICDYAQERNIEISPLIQGLGHASYILKHHWELRENPNSDWEFCPSDDRTYQLQFDLYRDAMEAMPYGRYLHVGGDEITAIGIDERCKKTKKTPFELQMMWLKKVSDFAIAHGRTPIFWDDMPLKNAQLWGYLHKPFSDSAIRASWNTNMLDSVIDLFPKNCVYMRWHYDDPTILSHRMLLDWYKKSGLKVMAATAASIGETPFIPRYNSRAQYIKDFSILTAQNNLQGILCTAWDDESNHWETVMRGFIAQGEFGWNPHTRSVKDFIQAHAQREFGLTSKQVDFIHQMEKMAYFFDRALIDSGSRNPAWGVSEIFTLIDIPDSLHAGTWTKKYQNKIDSAQTEYKRYTSINQDIKEAQQQALRNRYTLEVYQQTAKLFYFPVQLLLALKEYDVAQNTTQRAIAQQNIRTLCDDFQTMKNNLEAVYGKTRFMKNPDSYIADMNHHHHLAALTQNSDWIFLYEIPMVEKIKQWLSLKK